MVKKQEKPKVGDKIVIPSKRYNDFSRELDDYDAYGVIVGIIPKGDRFDVKFTEPKRIEGFRKYLKRSEFRMLKKGGKK